MYFAAACVNYASSLYQMVIYTAVNELQESLLKKCLFSQSNLLTSFFSHCFPKAGAIIAHLLSNVMLIKLREEECDRSLVMPRAINSVISSRARMIQEAVCENRITRWGVPDKCGPLTPESLTDIIRQCQHPAQA